MVPGGWLVSIEERQESPAPGAHPDCRNAFRRSASEIHDGPYALSCLGQVDVKQCQPILKGLQGKAAKDESNPESAKASFWQIVGIIFNVGIHRHAHPGNNSRNQAYASRKCECVFHVVNKDAANKGAGNVSDRADDSSPELTTREPRPACRDIVNGRTHSAGVRKNLADRDEESKRDGELKPTTL